MSEDDKVTDAFPPLWPNQKPIVDGVIPTEEIPQLADLFDGDSDEELDREMED